MSKEDQFPGGENSSTTGTDFHVIAVGTSAGGLDALTRMLGSFDEQPHNTAVIVVQHLSPNYKSELAAILSRHCKWKVLPAEHGVAIQPGYVYVTPQNKQIRYDANRTLALSNLAASQTPAPSIDQLLISLAEQEKQCAIAVILSGSGHDGVEGIKAVKEHGGFTIAQLPETAQYADMPLAAIQTDKVDAVLEPEKIFEEIVYYIKNHEFVSENGSHPRSIDVLFELLSDRSGVDFSQYKPNTFIRRLDKRIEALHLSGIGEYLQWIKKEPAELDNLFDTVLIGVTEFFRDPEAFTLLGEQLKTALESKRSGEHIRIWCVGCATGEEPYSIAILMLELLQESIANFPLQIFATDIDERALNFARKGVYSQKHLEKVPPRIVKKYFEETDQGFEVRKLVKQHILFSRHDITNDPPFVKLDMVVCRNLLIYFNNHLQREALRIFNYAIRPGGLLFLGKSESVTVTQDLFEKIDGVKLFKQTPSPAPLNLRFSRYRTRLDVQEETGGKLRNMSLIDIAKDTLYYSSDHPFVIINEQGNIKETQGSLRLYLDVGKGSVNHNVFKMANKEFVMEIRSLIARVRKAGTTQTSPIIKFHLFEKDHFVRLKTIPLIYPSSNGHFFLLMFERIEPDDTYIQFTREYSSTDFEDLRIKELEQEAASLREHLHTFTEELETTNEEMQAINEELQSANEELKSANEELETSNEELQSANEELNTSNQELRISNSLLIEKEAELEAARQVSERNALLYKTIAENIPNGTIGIMDHQLVVEYVNGKGLQRNSITANELVGRVFTTMIESPEERAALEEAFRKTLDGIPGSLEYTYKGKSFSINTVPLNLGDNDAVKIMYLTQDISEKVANESRIRRDEERFRALANNIPTLCWMANADGWIYWYNSRWYEYTGTTPEQMEGWGWQQVHDPNTLPQVMEKWKASLAGKTSFEMIFPLKGTDGQFRPFLTRIYPLMNEHNEVLQWLGTNTDISVQQSEAQELEQMVQDRTRDLTSLNTALETINDELVQAKEFLQLVIDSSVEYISVLDKNLRYVLVNRQFEQLTGKSSEEILGKEIFEILPGIKETPELDCVMKAKDGEQCHIKNRVNLLKADLIVDSYFVPYGKMGKPEGVIVLSRDITEIRSAEQALKVKNDELNQSNENLSQFAFAASHDLKEPIRKIKTFSSMVVDSYGDQLPEKGLHSLLRIQSAAGRMIDMVDGLLAYASIDSVKDPFDQVDLGLVMQNILSDLELAIQEKNALVEVDDLPVVEGVTALLYQLLLNLVKNALKFSKPDVPPHIWLHTRMYEEDKRKMVEITVRDNGIGFDPADANKIFVTFVRLHSRHKYEGTGLGLTLCKKIVDHHNGKIFARGNLDEGAEFIILLPVEQNHA